MGDQLRPVWPSHNPPSPCTSSPCTAPRPVRTPAYESGPSLCPPRHGRLAAGTTIGCEPESGTCAPMPRLPPIAPASWASYDSICHITRAALHPSRPWLKAALGANHASLSTACALKHPPPTPTPPPASPLAQLRLVLCSLGGAATDDGGAVRAPSLPAAYGAPQTHRPRHRARAAAAALREAQGRRQDHFDPGAASTRGRCPTRAQRVTVASGVSAQ